MKADVLLENLMTAVREKLPPGANLATTLSDILYMGKEAIYRRLRGEVPFTFTEVATLAEKMSLSLDNAVGLSMPDSSILYLNQIRFADPEENDYFHFERCNGFMKTLASEPYVEFGSSSNTLPQTVFYQYENISKFSLYKWMFQYGRGEAIKAFQDYEMPSRIRTLQNDFVKDYHEIKYSYHIWDDQLLLCFVKDIEYFRGIQMLQREDAETMKSELLQIIDDLETIATKGKFSNGNKVDFYISNTHFDSTYSYVETPAFNLSLIKIFSLNSLISYDTRLFNVLKNWIQSLKRVSILISESGEMQRVQFFRKQREIVNSIKL